MRRGIGLLPMGASTWRGIGLLLMGGVHMAGDRTAADGERQRGERMRWRCGGEGHEE
ncbi:hypothetical protein Aph02nite_58990 [Actinoplanes philippinensis]|nr:hypothetical protein Aph02nite_58990 [Actinoplanes philippinensis]